MIGEAGHGVNFDEVGLVGLVGLVDHEVDAGDVSAVEGVEGLEGEVLELFDELGVVDVEVVGGVVAFVFGVVVIEGGFFGGDDFDRGEGLVADDTDGHFGAFDELFDEEVGVVFVELFAHVNELAGGVGDVDADA